MTDKRPVVVIACKVFQGLLENYLPANLKDEVTFLDYGLHQVPKKLTEAVQETIDDINEPSRILLGYGLCGNGLNGIQAREHTLLIPRADDCIAILLGSYQAYLKAFNDNPGTYYLTKGWLESGSDPLKQYQQTVEKYGLETGLWIMDQQYMHYKRLVLVAHTQEDLETYRPRALKVAKFCERWGMQYEEVLGSDAYIRELVGASTTLSESNDQFLIIPPGGVIQQSQFLRIPM
jgi:hypothetical protein